MNWNNHFDLKGQHAFLSPSSYHWINYDDEKLISVWKNSNAAKDGTETHEFAELCINRKQKLPKSSKTLNAYVNDAIRYGLTPEVVLKANDICFGTADAIGYFDGMLRIHDLKTGIKPGSMEQLMIYAAIFCIEYLIDPIDIQYELRIYQNDTIRICNPDGKYIESIMNGIHHKTAVIEDARRKFDE